MKQIAIRLIVAIRLIWMFGIATKQGMGQAEHPYAKRPSGLLQPLGTFIQKVKVDLRG